MFKFPWEGLLAERLMMQLSADWIGVEVLDIVAFLLPPSSFLFSESLLLLQVHMTIVMPKSFFSLIR
jgi:hypothetical protein